MMLTIRARSARWFATGAVLTLGMTLMITEAWRVDAAPGDSDTTFVSITSCRLIDTRPPPLRIGSFSTWGAKDTKTPQATGSNGNCVIPNDAVGLSMNVTALNATSDGFLTFWPDGALPLGASLNPSPGQPPTPNAVSTLLSTTGSFKVYNENGTVDIIIDVNGYYTKSSLKEIDTRLTSVESSAASTASAVTGLDTRLTSVESSAASTASAVTDLDTRLKSLELGTSGSVVSRTTADSTTSQTYTDITGATTTATTVADGRLLITFSSEVYCADSPTPTTAWCQVQVLVDGVVASPSPVIYANGRVETDVSLWETASHQFVTGPLTAGSHTVQVQFRVDESSGSFGVDNWTLSALPLRP